MISFSQISSTAARDRGEIKLGETDLLMHDSFTAPECCGPAAKSDLAIARVFVGDAMSRIFWDDYG